MDKQIQPATLDVIVPSLILQPLVENSIKHGLSPKVGGGRITIASRLRNGHTIIEVVDDGLGMTEERLEQALGRGIGLSNVNERLRTIYGAALPAAAEERARPGHVGQPRNPRAGHSRTGDGLIDGSAKAVLVDDEQLARDELGFLLGQVGGVSVIGQAGNGVEALEHDRPAAAGRRVSRRPDAGPHRASRSPGA